MLYVQIYGGYNLQPTAYCTKVQPTAQSYSMRKANAYARVCIHSIYAPYLSHLYFQKNISLAQDYAMTSAAAGAPVVLL